MNLNKIDKQGNRISKLGRILGFVGGYFFSTTALFFIFSIFNKIPENWSYFHAAGIVLFIVLIGLIVQLLTGDSKEQSDVGGRPFFKGFKSFNQCIGLTINSILLTIVYIFGVGLVSLSAKLFKKRFLDLGTREKNSTYWTDLDLRKKSLKDYYRQF